MTVAINDRRARYSATAGQTSFDVDYPISADTEVDVWQKVDATGVISKLTLTTHYTVTLDGAAPNTADVDLVTGAALDDIIAIHGNTSPVRTSDFSVGGDYFAGTVNDAEDRQYFIMQERERDLDRAATLNPIQADAFDAALPEFTAASQLLGSNAAIDGFTVFTVATLGGVVLSDATPQAGSGSGSAGTSADVSRADHVHPAASFNLVDDTSAQLGSFLDPNGNYIGMDKGGDIASASPLVIDTDGDFFDVSGTTNFAAMTVAANRFFVLQFDGILTVTHGASMLLPGGANLTTAAGDRWICYSTAADTVIVLNVALAAAAGGSSVATVTQQVFTASGTYTPTSGMLYCIATVTGGGGGGGKWVDSSATASGGSAGGTAIEVLSADDIGASQVVTIGAGGAGATSSGAGVTGGTSSLGALLSATGGASVGTVDYAGTPGAGSGGDINISGGRGSAASQANNGSSEGGGSYWGSGPQSQGNSTTRTAGEAYGAGGIGGSSAQNGSAGKAGVITIVEYGT